MMRCPEECEKQSRPKQGNWGWENKQKKRRKRKRGRNERRKNRKKKKGWYPKYSTSGSISLVRKPVKGCPQENYGITLLI